MTSHLKKRRLRKAERHCDSGSATKKTAPDLLHPELADRKEATRAPSKKASARQREVEPTPISTCPREFIADGKKKLVPCNLWTCKRCAFTKTEHIVSCSIPLLHPVQHPIYHFVLRGPKILAEWRILRTHYPMRYIAVITEEPKAAPCMHALVITEHAHRIKSSSSAFRTNLHATPSPDPIRTLRYVLAHRIADPHSRLLHSHDWPTELSQQQKDEARSAQGGVRPTSEPQATQDDIDTNIPASSRSPPPYSFDRLLEQLTSLGLLYPSVTITVSLTVGDPNAQTTPRPCSPDESHG